MNKDSLTTLQVELVCEGISFEREEWARPETARILRTIADKIEHGQNSDHVADTSGRRCGLWFFRFSLEEEGLEEG